MPPASTNPDSKRIEMIDAIRGLALAGIVLIHNLQHFVLLHDADKNPAWLAGIDPWIHQVVFFFFSGKAYGIFSLLFGFSFWFQYKNQLHNDNEFIPRFAWRMVLLFGLGMLHGLFYIGDFLYIYALMSVVVVMTRHWSNRAVLILICILLLQPIDLIRVFYAYLHPSNVFESQVTPLVMRLRDIQLEGPFLKMLALNATFGRLSSLIWNWEYGRFFQAPALFLIGMLAARYRVFSKVRPKFWFSVLCISLIATIPLQILNFQLNAHIGRPSLRHLANTLNELYGSIPKIALVLALSVLLWHYSGHFRKLLSIFAPFGRMSLTNYITQSIIGTTLYMGYGFGLYRYCGDTLSLGIGTIILMIQLGWSHWWLKRFNQGPLEFLWRKGTWIGHERYQSIRLVKQSS